MSSNEVPTTLIDRTGREWTRAARQDHGDPVRYHTIGSVLALTAEEIKEIPVGARPRY